MLSAKHTYATIPASDMDRARSFYEKVLGLQPAETSPLGVSYQVEGGASFLLFPSSGKPSGTHTQLAFEVDDLESRVRELRERGVRFEAVDMDGYDPSTSIVSMEDFRGAWFRDPEGNLLSVGQREATH